MDPFEQRLPPFNAQYTARWKEKIEDPQTKLQLAKLLAKTSIFTDTIEAFRLAIVDAILPVQYNPAQIVYDNDEEGDWIAIVLSGRLERRRSTVDKSIQISVGEVGPGGIVGDLGLFGINPCRSFKVLSSISSVLLILTKSQFERAVKNYGGPVSLSLFTDGERMRDLMLDVESFVELRCFRNMDRDFILALRQTAEPRLYYPNQVLMKEGAEGKEMYILRAGEVKIEKKRVLVGKVGAGVTLGEMAVLGSDKRRNATVTCTSLCFVRVVQSDDFHLLLKQFPNTKRQTDHAYVTRLVSMEMQSAGEDLKKLDRFYGSATPRTDADMVELCGATLNLEGKKKRLEMAKGEAQRNIILPRIASPRGLSPRGFQRGTPQLAEIPFSTM